MPRPTDKKSLLDLSQQNYQKLLDFIHSKSDEEKQKTFPEGTLNRNLRDVVTHLHHWHLMMLSWHREGLAGKKPPMPADGYSWKDLPTLNQIIWQKYQGTSLEEGLKLLDSSHEKMMKTITSHSNEELFEKKKYPWTGSTSMGAYFISATSSHYDWALKLLRKAYRKMG